MENFSTNSLALKLSSAPFSEDDYMRDYEIREAMNKASIYDCSIIELPRIQNGAGNITPVSNSKEVPFDVKRVFYIYDIPGGEDRGAHAHKECHQFLVAAGDSFEIELNNGKTKQTIMLNRPYYGLHIPPCIWAAEKSFSSGAICLVL